MNMKTMAICGAVSAMLTAGCANGRLLSEQEAYAYCHTHNAGSTFGMNPLGEEYATWMSYCNPQYSRQALTGFAFGADVLQRQQIIDRMQPVTPAPITCYQQGFYTRCH